MLLNNKKTPFSICKMIVAICCGVSLVGCTSFISKKQRDFAESLVVATKKNDDIETVRLAMPSYLLLMDAVVIQQPEDISTLQDAAGIYTAYSAILPEESEFLSRRHRLTDKAMSYAETAICIQNQSMCGVRSQIHDDFAKNVATVDQRQIESLYMLGISWAEWIQVRTADWNAVAQLSKLRVIMDRIIKLDSRYHDGEPYMYLGILDTILPEAYGGKLEQGKNNFMQAIQQSDGKNLMAKVLLAKQYARKTFDQKLHDELLKQVIAAKPNNNNLLMDTIAKNIAHDLLEDSDDYFL